jgi:hypothetical protein
VPAVKNYQIEKGEVSGVRVSIATYQIGEKFYCHIMNEDPGATISRGEGANQEEARQMALVKAAERLR